MHSSSVENKQNQEKSIIAKYGDKFVSEYLYRWYDNPYMSLKNKEKFNSDQIDYMIEHNPSIHNQKKLFKYQNLVCDILKEHQQIENVNNESLRNMAMNKNLFLYIKYLVKKNINVPIECFNIAIINNNYRLFDFLSENSKHDKLTIDHLENACRYSNAKTISKILSHKMIPNQKCFDNALMHHNPFILKRNNLGIIVSGTEIENFPTTMLIIDNGYHLTQDDFVALTKKYIYIKNYKDYGLELDDQIKKIYHSRAYYPYDEIPPSDIGIRNGFKKVCTMAVLKALKKQYKIKFDLEYLRVACSNPNIRVPVLKYLINDCHIKPTIECLLLAIDARVTISVIAYIRDNLENEEGKKYDLHQDTETESENSDLNDSDFNESDSEQGDNENIFNIHNYKNYCSDTDVEISSVDSTKGRKCKKKSKKKSKKKFMYDDMTTDSEEFNDSD